MNDNPYESPTGNSNVGAERSHFCVGMRWLTVALSVIGLVIVTPLVLANFSFALQNGGRLPTYVTAVMILIAISVASMFISSLYWKTQRIVAGALSMIGAFALFFLGPQLLLILLMP